jgi:hypothetical protein
MLKRIAVAALVTAAGVVLLVRAARSLRSSEPPPRPDAASWMMRLAAGGCIVLALWLTFGTVRITFEDRPFTCGPAVLSLLPLDAFTERDQARLDKCVGMGFARLFGAAGAVVGAVFLLRRTGLLRTIPPRPDVGG